MRRFFSATVLLLAAAALLASSAAAKEMSVSLGSSPPADLTGSGSTWTADLLVHGEPEMLSQATPGIWIENMDSGETESYAAKSTGKKAPDGQLLYRVDVKFPSEGSWRYALIDGVTDREYEGGTIQIGQNATALPSEPAPVSPAAEGNSVPVWPFALGGSLLLLAAAGAALAVRHRRPHPA